MVYLSKLLLDPSSRQVQAELANRYELHRTLTAQFQAVRREEIGLLYRVEIPRSAGFEPIAILCQSLLEPNWSGLVGRGLLLNQPQVKTFELNLPEGNRYHFRLLANPTVRRVRHSTRSAGSSLSGQAGKRVGLYKLEEQVNWLARKADESGFRVESVQTTKLGMVECTKRKDERSFQIKHFAVQFDGLLTITSAEIFQKAVHAGIGSAKAFGFGLLSLAK